MSTPRVADKSSTMPAEPDGAGVLQELLSGVGEARADLVGPGSFSMAVVTAEGAARWIDPSFRALIGDVADSVACRRLIAEARRSGRAAGLVASLDRGAVVVEARARSQTGAWPLAAEIQAGLAEVGERLLLVAFAPSRDRGLALVASATLGLTPREADLAAALLEAPTLEVAASRVGMSVDTAKDALERAGRRIGVRGASELVGRLLDLTCGPADNNELSAGETLGLTKAETRIAHAVSQGWTVARTADALGLSRSTVKSHRKTIFAKTGASRDRDLRRLFLEASRLDALKGVSEVLLEDRGAGERLRVVARSGGRRVAFMDYGPASGRPLMVMHGFTTGRRLPAPFVARLQRDGWRPLVIQRPGFGLTDPASSNFLVEAAEDMIGVLDRLGEERLALLARDGGVATALTFTDRYPDRFVRGALVNPRSTRERPVHGFSAIGALSAMLMRQPVLIAAAAEALRRRTAGAHTRTLLARLYSDLETDGLADGRPDIVDHVVRDVQAMSARTARGLIDELRVYAEGWRIPNDLAGATWRVAWGTRMWSAPESVVWSAAGAETRLIDGLGLLGAYTHPDALADLLAG